MPATEQEENASVGGGRGVAAGQVPAAGPGHHLGGKRKREGAALWAKAKARFWLSLRTVVTSQIAVQLNRFVCTRFLNHIQSLLSESDNRIYP
jgi:hypothetical protein